MQPIVSKDNKVYYPFISVNPTYSVIFNRSDVYTKKTEQQEKQFETIKNAVKFDGVLSDVSKRKIRNIVNWLNALSEWKRIEIDGKNINAKLSFITLTLPSKQMHTDNEIKNKCLNQFFVETRKIQKDFLYIWKAEKQSNGNIHFHITSNLLMHYKDLQDIWNRILNKFGYVDVYSANQKRKYSKGFFFDVKEFELYKTDRQKQFLRYKKGLSEGWRHPHSVEIKSVKNIKDIAAYVSEYISKNPKELDEAIEKHKNKELTDSELEEIRKKLTVTGRIYGCSKCLETLKITIPLLDYDIDLYKFKFASKDFVTVFYCNIMQLFETDLRQELAERLYKHLSDYEVN